MARHKKGALEATTIVGIILLLIGFGIVLTIMFRIYYSGQASTEICKESVVFRATGVRGSLETTGEFIPLKCQPNNICVTSGLLGGTCDDKFLGEKFTKAKVKDENGVSKVIADEIVSCWDVMGQGRLSLFSTPMLTRFGLTSIEDEASICVICSRIVFDSKTLAEKKIILNNVNVFDYMLKHYVPGTEFTYATWLGTNSPAGVSINADALKGKIAADQGSAQEVQDTSSNDIAVIFMQVATPPTRGQVAMNNVNGLLAGAAGGGAIKTLIPGGGWLLGKTGTAIWGFAAANPITAAIIGIVVVGGGTAYEQIQVSKNYAISSGYCGDIKFGGDESYGCSAVRVVNYNAESLQKFCKIIEGM